MGIAPYIKQVLLFNINEYDFVECTVNSNNKMQKGYCCLQLL